MLYGNFYLFNIFFKKNSQKVDEKSLTNVTSNNKMYYIYKTWNKKLVEIMVYKPVETR